MKTKITVFQVMHWIFIASGYGVSIALLVQGSGDIKLAGMGTIALAIASTIHTATTAPKDETVAAAVAAVIPMVQAATIGNSSQAAAVNTAVAVIQAVLPLPVAVAPLPVVIAPAAAPEVATAIVEDNTPHLAP